MYDIDKEKDYLRWIPNDDITLTQEVLSKQLEFDAEILSDEFSCSKHKVKKLLTFGLSTDTIRDLLEYQTVEDVLNFISKEEQ